ncbi:unnamed protein product [Acanthoscelides obtectus]|uniref:Uncharacterized protein n=1 Tax=Acanthoscelides obtectus TaxID=200917 RepID=A0A9P0KRV7_ACAOB|nr:unnamed protein product [Acanthoscelides obtectus]
MNIGGEEREITSL